MKVFLHNAPKTRVAVSLSSIVLGGAVIGVTSPITITNIDFFYGFGLAFSQGGGDPAFTSASAALVAAAVGGGLMLASGLFGLAGHFARSQVLLITFLLFTFVGSLVAVIGGGIFLQVPGLVGERIYFDDTNSINPPLEGTQKDVNDFELAIFNECCISKNWTDQRAAQVCTGNNDNDCPDITDTVVTDAITNAKILLCSCATSGSKLAQFQTSIRETGFCKKAQSAVILTQGLTLPRKVPGNLKLVTLTARRYSGLVYNGVPLVGWHKVAGDNPDQVEASAHPLPFGCGLGYQKGIAWMTDLWFQQNAVQGAYGSLAIGLINIGLVILAIVISVMQTREDEKYGSTGKVDRWENVKDIPSTFASTANPTHQPNQIVVAGYSGASSSGHNSLANSTKQQPQQVNAKEELFEQLRDFYAKHDKDKSLSDVEDVASWAIANGIPALNAKLQSKYQADLNSVGSRPTTGLGAKALKGDLDI